jgi:3-hydroxyisobutyrate dehydrogenase
MVGGDEAAYQRAKPFFDVMGKIVVFHGGPGSGQLCKLCNQIGIASVMMSWCEALAFGQRAGLDPARVLESVSGGAAGSVGMTVLAPRALRGDFAPGFYVKHFLKDLRLALESAEELKLDLPGTTLAKKLYDEVSRRGGDGDGTQALFRLYQAAQG